MWLKVSTKQIEEPTVSLVDKGTRRIQPGQTNVDNDTRKGT